MLAGFFKLTSALQQRANECAEALQAEIDSLKEQVEDLTAPWLEVSHEAHKRSEAMQYAASLSEQTGPKRAEALRSVVDRIVCHFRYTKGNRSMIDAVEVVPVSGDTLCFTEEVSLGPSFFRKALYRVYTWAEIEPIYGQPWKESQAKAVEARKAAAKRRRKGQ